MKNALILVLTIIVSLFAAMADASVGIVEFLGDTVPHDLELLDESGRGVRLGELINGPTVLSFVYYGCRSMCPLILRGEAELVNDLDLVPGRDYNLVTISFDENNTPEDSAHTRKNYLAMLDESITPGSWRFLTGTREQIASITNATGFRFLRTGDGFAHTAALIVLSPKGKIVRYIYGVSYLPFDMKMALLEAHEEKVGLSARRVLLYCFRYDPEGKTYVFNILKVAGTLITICGIMFFMYLLRAGRKRREEYGEDE